MFEKAGYRITVGARSYFPDVDDPELSIVLLRAQEISIYVEDGVFDCGITGKDWIEENGSKVHEVSEFVYAKSGFGKVRWVIAVPENSKIRKVEHLDGKRIATEAVNITKKFLRKHGVRADVEFSWGATEAKTPTLVDAIVDVTETGSSLRANNLRIVDTIMESTTRFIANRDAWKNKWKRRKMENMTMLLQGALNAEKKVGVKMNVREKDLKRLLKLIPSLQNPRKSGRELGKTEKKPHLKHDEITVACSSCLELLEQPLDHSTSFRAFSGFFSLAVGRLLESLGFFEVLQDTVFRALFLECTYGAGNILPRPDINPCHQIKSTPIYYVFFVQRHSYDLSTIVRL